LKRVLVTGASGFIGRHCLPLLLERGYEVHAASSQAKSGTEEAVYWHQTNLLERGQTSQLLAEVKPDYLLHLAWYAVPGLYWKSPENLSWVEASLHLLQEFTRQGGKRLVMAGSCAEYDWKYGFCSELTTPTNPSSLYGTSKHALQLILNAFAAEAGISSAWGRIFWLYGPHEYPNRLVASISRALLMGQEARSTHGNQIRDFLHVEDVAAAFVALMESKVQGPVNIASGQPVTLKQIISKIADLTGRADLLRLGAIAAPADEAPLVVADVRRLTQTVGWLPRYDLDSGLTQMIEWWKTELNRERTN